MRRVSDSVGRGVFAAEPLRQGCFVLEFRGERIDERTARLREHVYAGTNTTCFLMTVSPTLVIDPTALLPAYGVSPFLNHAHKHECTLFARRVRVDQQWRVAMFATRDIAIGEQLTFDYGDRRSNVIDEFPFLQS